MGGCAGFSKAVRPFIEPFKPPDPEDKNQVLLIDTSVLIHNLHYRDPKLAYGVFVLGPYDSSEAARQVVEAYASEIIAMVSSVGFPAQQTFFYFEETSPKSQRRASRKVSNRSRLLNRGLRAIHVHPTKSRSAFGMRSVARSMTRPESWFIEKVIDVLKRRYGCTDDQVKFARTPVQADALIIQDARKMKEVNKDLEISIFSHDRDFLALSKYFTVTRIVYSPKNGGTLKQILFQRIQELLPVLEQEESLHFRLSLAYSMAGCDDIETHFKGLGWSTAIKVVKNARSIDDALGVLKQGLYFRKLGASSLEKFKKEYENLMGSEC